MLGQDLLKLPGYGGYCDGIPHLEQHRLQPGKEMGGERRDGCGKKREQVVSNQLVQKRKGVEEETDDED